MHFVYGHGQVADHIEDGENALAMCKKLAFCDGEIERVGYIIKFDRHHEDRFTVNCWDERSRGENGEYKVHFMPLFQRFESVKKIY